MAQRLIILTIVLLLQPILAFAAGIQVNPEKLEFVLKENKTQSKKIIVANPTADVQIFEIYPDEFEQIITADPKTFTLEAGDRREVTIIVEAKNVKAGSLSTALSVLGRPLADSRVQVNTGVKIPLTITKSEESDLPWNYFYILLLALIVAILSIGYFITKRNKKTRAD